MSGGEGRKRKAAADKAAETPPEPAGAAGPGPAGQPAPPEAGAPERQAEAPPEAPAEVPPEGPGEGPGEEKPEAEIARLNDRLLRALADLENLRRRAERDREEIAKYAVTGFAREILTVADNLRRALDAIPAEARGTDELLNNLALGVEATERELLAAFERHGMRKIEPLGERFNPEVHQAMFELENTGKPPGTVVEVMQVGYLLHDRLLRPAMVALAKGEPEERKVDTTA